MKKSACQRTPPVDRPAAFSYFTRAADAVFPAANAN
jgi:hypothetical protein